MKRLIAVLLVALTFGLAAQAQAQTKYREFFETGVSTVVGNYAGPSYHISNTHGFKFGSMFVGLGYGYDYYWLKKKRHTQVWNLGGTRPVFIDLKRYDEDAKNSLILDAKAGISFDRKQYIEDFCEFGIGRRMVLKGDSALSASLFCKLYHDDYNDGGCTVNYRTIYNVGFKLAIEIF